MTYLATSRGFDWVQGASNTKPFVPQKHPGWRDYQKKVNPHAVPEKGKLEILLVDSEIFLLQDSFHYDAVKIKFPVFKMWKATNTGDSHYTSVLLDHHQFVHEIPPESSYSTASSTTKSSACVGKKTSFVDLQKLGFKPSLLRGDRKKSSVSSFKSADTNQSNPDHNDHDQDHDHSESDDEQYKDVENLENDEMGEMNIFLLGKIDELREICSKLRYDNNKLEMEFAKEDSELEILRAKQLNSVSDEQNHDNLQHQHKYQHHNHRHHKQIPQFESEETTKLFTAQLSVVEHLDRRHYEAQEKLNQTEAEIQALEDELAWVQQENQSRPSLTLPNPPEDRFDIELVDASLTTVLSPNPIQHHLTIKAWLAPPKAKSPGRLAMYDSTYTALGFFHDNRDYDVGNWVGVPMNITVLLPRISWNVSQAQYKLIVSLITDNFGADPSILPEPNPPDPDPVFDEETAGFDVFKNNNLALQLVVPCYFESVELILNEDEEIYFENLENAMAVDVDGLEEGGGGGKREEGVW